MDVRADEVGAGVLPRTGRRGLAVFKRAFAFPRGLTDVLARQRIATWEWGLAIGALFILGRSPVLFARNLVPDLFGGKAGAIWQDDLVLVSVFTVTQIAVLVVAARRCDARALLRQPTLLAVLALAWVSMMWSVEPSVTAQRALLFAGTAGVGWYVGDRFTIRDQVSIVAKVALGAAVLSLIAVIVYPAARHTGVLSSSWSGVYVNRNILSLVLSFGLLAAIFLTDNTRRKALLRGSVLLLAFMVFASKSRTGSVALVVAVAIVLTIHGLRKLAKGSLNTSAAATVIFLAFGTAGLYVHFNWVHILTRLQRSQSLSGRTAIWQMDRWFSRGRPWEGWGFEAIWANKRAIAQAKTATHIYPYSSHNGYYEMLLSVGRIGLGLFILFLAVAAWRAFKYAWEREDFMSLWPLAVIVFAVIANFSESLFVSSEATWALTVAAAIGATEWARREDPSVSYALPAPRAPSAP